MGHRFSKTAASAAVTTTTTLQGNSNCYAQIIQSGGNHHHSLLAAATAPTFNLHIQGTSPTIATTTKSPSTTTTAGCSQFISEELSTNNSSLSTINNLSCGSQIIIKIQLAKMETGNETTTTTTAAAAAAATETIFDNGDLGSNQINVATTTTTTSTTTSSSNSSSSNDCSSGSPFDNYNNKQITTIATAGAHILNLTIDKNILPTTTSTLSSNNINRSANVDCNDDMAANYNNESLINNNNNNNKNNSNFNEFLNEDSIEYCEVMGQDWANNLNVLVEEPETNACCRRRTKSTTKSNNMNNETNSASVAALKRRCRKCSCRDAFRRILDTSSSRLTNKLSKQQQLQKNKEKFEVKHSKSSSNTAIMKIGRKGRDKELPVDSKNSLQSMITTTGLPNTLKHSTTTTATSTIQNQHRPTAAPPTVMTDAEDGNSVLTTAATTTTTPNQLLIRATPTNAGNGEVIIPITAPSQFLVVQCAILNATAAAPSTLPSTSTNNNDQSNNCTSSEALLSLSKTMELIGSTIVKNQIDKNLNHNNNNNGSRGSIVHSQVDFRHFLVPDLERITGASFYWGKIDRYEAERLLEDKPEGTFLLRDSAQEEFLFSVTFRKYGRSLHARIEQSGHRFSFDCHDPGVYTASTVMGLLEHYKDPACVMFFEPMLTTPLNRDFSFSLQQLCRATIASHIAYDGISELELPARMKSYLKEYHYKQKLRVKPFDELFYTPCST